MQPSPAERRRRALEFEQCPDCGMDLVSGRGRRPCREPRCPFLPEELDTVCPDCGYDVATGRGRAACGGPGRCRFAHGEGRRRLALVRAWQARREDDGV